jgi:hypothetical protein
MPWHAKPVIAIDIAKLEIHSNDGMRGEVRDLEII